MTNELRKLLQTELSSIENLSSGIAKPDDMIKDDEIYYGYELTTSVSETNVEYEFNDLSITLTGRLVSRNKKLSEMDAMANNIAKVLKKLRFKYTIQDVTRYDTTNKMIINGRVNISEINYLLR